MKELIIVDVEDKGLPRSGFLQILKITYSKK